MQDLHNLHDEWLTPKCEYPVMIFNNDKSTIVDDYGKVEHEIMEWLEKPVFKII